MIKIAVFQTDLEVGGIQKSLVNLLNNLDYNSVQVDLFITKEKDEFFSDLIPNEVEVFQLKRKSKFIELLPFNIFKYFFSEEYKEYYLNKKYDVSIDFNSYNASCALSALVVESKKKVIWVHNHISLKKREEKKYWIIWNLEKTKYQYFDEYALVSGGIVDSFMYETGISDKPMNIIPNIIDINEIENKKNEKIDIKVCENNYNLVFVGRLSHQKGVDILIDLLSEVVEEKKDLHLYIIGDGPDKNKLINKVKNQKLTDYITFLGNQNNPFKYMNAMDGFILTSRYEGQGMVIREAQAIGLDLFITQNLEKYNEGVPSNKNIKKDIIDIKKGNKKIYDLERYNNEIIERFIKLIN